MLNPLNLTFDIVIDESFTTINTDSTLKPVDNKKVLGLLNNFENKNWRYDNFHNFIWDNIKETALSAKERASLIENGEGTLLSTAAKNLRFTDKENDPTKGSELAEIALYGIMRRHYNALPVVPKIFYKQNPQDPAKGSDSVHIVIEGENDFSLWFGEAKFYNSIEDDRLGEIIKSVGNSLEPDKLKKENSIITNVRDLEILIPNETFRNKIISFLDSRKSTDDIKAKIQIPILLLHECNITKGQQELTSEYKSSIIEHHKDRAQSYFKKQIEKLSAAVSKYSEIKFHIILFPVPDKQKIIDTFIKKADALRS